MGRRKLEMKRIEDKSSRQVTFSKRRGGLMKKARQISVLCDVHVAVVIFSSRGKLYESSSGSSLGQILERYEKSCVEAEGPIITGTDDGVVNEYYSPCTRYRTCQELLQTVERFVGEPNDDTHTVNDFVELEEELDTALMQIRSRKTQLLMEYVATLQEKEKKLREENEQIGLQVAEAVNNDRRDGFTATEPNGLAANRIHLPPLETLPLFPT